MLADIHVGCHNKGGKMIVESAQLLANCYSADQLKIAPLTQKGNVRKYSYYNHPCSKWVRQSYYHFEWLLIHAIEMVEEKMYRDGGLHFCYHFINWCYNNSPNLPDVKPLTPALAMPDIYKKNNPVESYRDYYRYDKLPKLGLTWTNRERPNWI